MDALELLAYGNISDNSKDMLCLNMLPYNVSVKLGRDRYDLFIDRKVVIISDDTAKGKTQLCNIVRNSGKNGAEIKGRIMFVDSFYTMKPYEDTVDVFLIDEDSACINNERKLFIEYISKDKNHLFIIITRDVVLEWLPYSPDDMFLFYDYKKTIYLRKKYECPIFESRPCLDYAMCYIEDSTSGYAFFDSLLDVPVKSFYGKSNWGSLRGINSILVVFDRCGFGSEFDSFYEYVTFTNKSVSVLDYESFEYLLLDLLQLDIPDARLSYNKEKLYTVELSKYLMRYSKSMDCKCCLQQCNTCSHNKKCLCVDEAIKLFSIFKRSRYGKYLSLM